MGEKLTLEIIKRKLQKINPNIQILSENYVNNVGKLKCKCIIDNYKWEASWSNLQAKKGCPKCAGNIKLNIEDIKNKLKDINPNIDILSNEYINTHKKLKCKCKIHNHIWNISWSCLVKGQSCPKCGKIKSTEKNKLTLENIKNMLDKINPNIEILSNKYINSGEKLHCRCKIDGHEWLTPWDNLKQGKGCPKCAGTIKLTLEEIKEKLKIINPNIEILSHTYINSNSKLKCKCKIDGYEWETSWGNISHSKNCPKCAGNAKLTLKEVKDRLKFINPDIEILSDNYINSDSKLKCRCKIDNYKWEATWYNLNLGKGCPKCNASKGEKIILKYLNKNKINYISQQKYNDLLGIGNRKLSYDFYLPQYNLLIEYQGEQHKNPVDFNGKGNKEAMKRLLKQREHDKRKKEYAKLHNLELFEIWYWDFDNIEIILEDKLNELHNENLVQAI